MTETVEHSTPASYRTLSAERAVALRVERIAELEADHYRLTLVAEEAGRLTAEQHGQRQGIEARIEYHAAIVWPETSDDDDGDGGEHRAQDGDVPARPQRGTAVEAPGASPDELGPPLRDEEHVHRAAHSTEPVEDDPDLDDGAPLGDVTGGADEDVHPLSRLQRISHYPSVADRLGVEE